MNTEIKQMVKWLSGEGKILEWGNLRESAYQKMILWYGTWEWKNGKTVLSN